MKTATESHFVFMVETLTGRFPTSLVRVPWNLKKKKDLWGKKNPEQEYNHLHHGDCMVLCSFLFWPGSPACSPSYSYTLTHTVAAESKGSPSCRGPGRLLHQPLVHYSV